MATYRNRIFEIIESYKKAQDELIKLRREIKDFRETAYSAASASNYSIGSRSRSYSGSRVEHIVIELEKRENKAAKAEIEVIQLKKKLYESLYEIDDSSIRLPILCKYVMGMSWAETAKTIKDGRCAESLRIAVQRFMQGQRMEDKECLTISEKNGSDLRADRFRKKLLELNESY